MTATRAMRTMIEFLAQTNKDDRTDGFEEALEYMLDAVEYRNKMVKAFFALPEDVQHSLNTNKSHDGKADLHTLMWCNKMNAMEEDD